MNFIALPSEIVKNIFNFMDPYDVHNFKIACPSWDLEATRWLGKCRAIETFSLSEIMAIIPSDMIDGRIEDYEKRYPGHYEIMVQSLISNILMNKCEIPEVFLEPGRRAGMVHWDPLCWCYFKENNEYHQILESDLERCIKISLANSQRDHVFSFITYRDDLKTQLESTYAPIPVAGLMIKQVSNEFDLGNEILDFDPGTFEKIPKAPYPFKYEISIDKDLNAFNINQWTTQTKIISTDWEHSSSYQDLNDPDYPIKSLICFKTIPFSCERLDYLIKNKDIVVSYVVLCRWSTLHIKAQKWHEKSGSRILSIAFAGKNVKAATLSIESLDFADRAEKLMAFRQSLDFSVDDGRIVGFIFVGDILFAPNVGNEILISIYKTFPHVNFMDISCWGPKDSPTAEQGLIEGIRIHLVHL